VHLEVEMVGMMMARRRGKRMMLMRIQRRWRRRGRTRETLTTWVLASVCVAGVVTMGGLVDTQDTREKEEEGRGEGNNVLGGEEKKERGPNWVKRRREQGCGNLNKNDFYLFFGRFYV
jgi:hypothetical protein